MTPLDAPEPGFRDMALLDMPAPPAPDRSPGQAPVREAAGRRRLQARFLRAGREAVDDRELLELLLSGRQAGQRCGCARRRPAEPLRHRAARPRRPARPAAHGARRQRGRHRRHQDRRGARHPHGARRGAGHRAPVIRQLRQGDRVLPHARRATARSRSSTCFTSIARIGSSPTNATRKAPSATPRYIPGRSACGRWSFRPARSSRSMTTLRPTRNRPGPTST